MEDFEKMHHKRECEFSDAPTFCVIFKLGLSEGVNILPRSAKWAYLLGIHTPCGIQMELPNTQVLRAVLIHVPCWNMLQIGIVRRSE